MANGVFHLAYGPDAGEKVRRGSTNAGRRGPAKTYYAAGFGRAGETPEPAALRGIYAPILPAILSLLQRARETAAEPQERLDGVQLERVSLERLRLEMLELSFSELCRLLGRNGLVCQDASWLQEMN